MDEPSTTGLGTAGITGEHASSFWLPSQDRGQPLADPTILPLISDFQPLKRENQCLVFISHQLVAPRSKSTTKRMKGSLKSLPITVSFLLSQKSGSLDIQPLSFCFSNISAHIFPSPPNDGNEKLIPVKHLLFPFSSKHSSSLPYCLLVRIPRVQCTPSTGNFTVYFQECFLGFDWVTLPVSLPVLFWI